MTIKIKQTLLICGDIIALYCALFLTLLLRYGFINDFYIAAHLGPFSIVFAFWIVLFYIAGLYDIKNLKNNYSFLKQFTVAIFSGAVLAIIMFYSIKYFTISPKTNLAIFTILFSFLGLAWRLFFNSTIKTPQQRLLIIGSDDELTELESYISENPQIGYHVQYHIPDVNNIPSDGIRSIINKEQIDTIIFNYRLEKKPLLIKEIYQHCIGTVEVFDSISAYELIFKKLPLSHLQDVWILTRLSRRKGPYSIIKRPVEFFFACMLGIILLPLFILISLCIRITSRGPIIYKQTRVGKHEHLFPIYKFRTMVADAEKHGPQWAQENDPRITFIGKILRFSHLDELPQIYNVIKGDLSFVGPRPERPEFVKTLKEEIPHYELRHIVKPGITGWAQVNYRYGSSVKDSYIKLQYDMYYVKERSFILDLFTVLKTVKMFLMNYK